MLDSLFKREELSTVAEAVGRDVEDAHDERAFTNRYYAILDVPAADHVRMIRETLECGDLAPLCYGDTLDCMHVLQVELAELTKGRQAAALQKERDEFLLIPFSQFS
jgi:hypothetical protein